MQCWLKRRLQHRCFPVNFTKFLRIPFLRNTLGGCFWKKQWYKLQSCKYYFGSLQSFSAVSIRYEVWNSRVTKSSYETELRKMTFHFESLTGKLLQKFFFRVANSKIKLLFFYFRVNNSKLKNKKSHFELLSGSQKIRKITSSY